MSQRRTLEIEQAAYIDSILEEADWVNRQLADWKPLRKRDDQFFKVHTRHGDHY
jgi:hypothetical protein